jgi:uncharacterized protein involved in exopolysaccharide biosynthesis
MMSHLDHNKTEVLTSLPDPVSNHDPQSSCFEQGDNVEFKLVDLLLILARHWKLIIGVSFTTAVITAVITLFMPNIYTAKAMVLPTDDDNGGMMGAVMAQMGGLAGIVGDGLGGTSKADLFVTILKSETLKDPLIDRFKLMELYETKFRSIAYKTLDDCTDISPGKKDGVITIAVDNEDPKLAAALANTYVQELGTLLAKLNMNGAGQNRAFLEERLTKAKVDLATAEEKLKTFQTQNKAVAVPDQAKATLDGVAQLRAQLITQEIQLATLRRQFTDESQEVKSAKSSITNLRGQIARLEGSAVQGSMPGVGAMPQLGQEYIRLMREFKVQEALVELLTKQYEMTKLSEAKDIAPFQVLQKAKVPDRKSKPKRSFIVILATFATGFVMVLFVFIREFASRMNDEDRLRWQELQRLLPLPRRFREKQIHSTSN